VASTYDCALPDQRTEGLAAAARAVRAGRLVVLPTDTVYGIGCDAFSSAAVRSLLSAKQRGPDMPVPVLVGSWSTIDGLVLGVPKAARDLIEAFWPGGLSLVLPHAPSLKWDLGSTKGTVMLRMPLHPVALELLRDVGPMAVSSANVSGQPPAASAAEARSRRPTWRKCLVARCSPLEPMAQGSGISAARRSTVASKYAVCSATT